LADSSGDFSRFHIDLGRAHTIIAKACLGTLLRLDGQDNEFGIMDRFPLAKYAAEHWVDHAQFEKVVSQIQEMMETLFNPDKPYFSAWIQIHDIDIMPSGSSASWHIAAHNGRSVAGPLYYAALCGFHDLAKHLIDNCSQQVNASGGFCVSPLVAALTKGHFKTAELLYRHDADVDAKGHNSGTPLFGLSCSGHLEMTLWLLRRGADLNVQEENGWTPLHGAAGYGHPEVAQILLQHNADKNIKNSYGLTPLHMTLEWGFLNVNVARLLLEHGVDVNARSNDGSTALHLALRQGQLEVARLLIEHGADVGAENNEGRTPFQVASESDMAKLLSGHGSSEGM